MNISMQNLWIILNEYFHTSQIFEIEYCVFLQFELWSWSTWIWGWSKTCIIKYTEVLAVNPLQHTCRPKRPGRPVSARDKDKQI